MPVRTEKPEQRNGTFEGVFACTITEAKEMVKLSLGDEVPIEQSHNPNTAQWYRLILTIMPKGFQYPNILSIFGNPEEIDADGVITRNSSLFKIENVYRNFGINEYQFDEDRGIWISPYQQLVGLECLALFYRKPSENSDKGYFTQVYDEIYPVSESNKERLETSFKDTLEAGYIQVNESSIYVQVESELPF